MLTSFQNVLVHVVSIQRKSKRLLDDEGYTDKVGQEMVGLLGSALTPIQKHPYIR